MHIALPRHARLRVATALIPVTLGGILAGYLSNGTGNPGPTVPAHPASATITSTSADSVHATRIVLRGPDGQATATLDDTPAARQFAVLLPLRLTLHDAMGQAKTGHLPHPIDVSGADRVIDPDAATIYYCPPPVTSASTTTTSARPSPHPAWSASAPLTADSTRSPPPETGSPAGSASSCGVRSGSGTAPWSAFEVAAVDRSSAVEPVVQGGDQTGQE